MKARTIQLPTFAAVAWLLLAASPMTAESVGIKAYRRVLAAPADVMVTVNVPRDPDNRALTIQADSGDYLSASTIPLDGEYEKRAHQFWFKNLPEGEYSVIARVEGTRGVHGTAALTISVVGLKNGK